MKATSTLAIDLVKSIYQRKEEILPFNLCRWNRRSIRYYC